MYYQIRHFLPHCHRRTIQNPCQNYLNAEKQSIGYESVELARQQAEDYDSSSHHDHTWHSPPCVFVIAPLPPSSAHLRHPEGLDVSRSMQTMRPVTYTYPSRDAAHWCRPGNFRLSLCFVNVNVGSVSFLRAFPQHILYLDSLHS